MLQMVDERFAESDRHFQERMARRDKELYDTFDKIGNTFELIQKDLKEIRRHQESATDQSQDVRNDYHYDFSSRFDVRARDGRSTTPQRNGRGGMNSTPRATSNNRRDERPAHDLNATINLQQLIIAGKPKLPTYNGKGAWKAFITQFEMHAGLGSWDDNQRKTMMLLCLEDAAAEFYTMLIEMGYNFDEVRRRMEQRFGKRELPQTMRSKFHQLKQLADEDIFEWAERVQKVGFEAFRDVNIDQPYIVEEMVRRFCQGCYDKEVAQYVADKNPGTMDQALEFVRLHEHNSKAIFGSRKVRQLAQVPIEDTPEVLQIKSNNNNDFSDALKKMYDKLDQLISVQRSASSERTSKDRRPSIDRSQQASRAGRSRTPSPSPRKCYYCGKPGHFIRDCPTRDKSPGRRCFHCGDAGHFSDKCTQKTTPKVQFADDPLNSQRRLDQ